MPIVTVAQDVWWHRRRTHPRDNESTMLWCFRVVGVAYTIEAGVNIVGRHMMDQTIRIVLVYTTLSMLCFQVIINIAQRNIFNVYVVYILKF